VKPTLQKASGDIREPNGTDGVLIDSTTSNTVGGTNPGERNVISGNTWNGIEISGTGANNNVVSVNLIGTNAGGTSALGNGNDGVYIVGNSNNVGAAGAMQRTIISANGYDGIEIASGNLNVVANCYIGTDISGAGNSSLGNEGSGIVVGSINQANNNTIGGIASGVRNVISNNGTAKTASNDFGILITEGTANVIQSNYIGTKADGTGQLGNYSDGIYLKGTADNTTIGGVAGKGNVICANGTNGGDITALGVRIESSNNLVTQNNIGEDVNGNLDANASTWLVIVAGNGNVTTPNTHN
jgi:hypothetical protein